MKKSLLVSSIVIIGMSFILMIVFPDYKMLFEAVFTIGIVGFINSFSQLILEKNPDMKPYIEPLQQSLLQSIDRYLNSRSVIDQQKQALKPSYLSGKLVDIVCTRDEVPNDIVQNEDGTYTARVVEVFNDAVASGTNRDYVPVSFVLLKGKSGSTFNTYLRNVTKIHYDPTKGSNNRTNPHFGNRGSSRS